MVLEKYLKLPILQVGIGKFSVPADLSLAVLHSRRLSIYVMQSEEKFSTLKSVHDHEFDRNAFNFCSGHFGHSPREVICVQSVDGALFFLDHETFLTQIQLPDFLIPGPLTYAETIDSLIITNTNLELECYRYSSLTAMTNNNIN